MGGMGKVYQATDTKLNRQVALKVLPELLTRSENAVARFRRETQVLASLNHPHVAQIYEFRDQGDEVIYSVVKGGQPNDDLWAVNVETGETRKLIENVLAGKRVSLSPCGRWMAYLPTESGQQDVYVRSYPALSSAVRISSNGASLVTWHPTSSELIYLDDNGYVIAVEMGIGDDLEIGNKEVLFNIGSRKPFALAVDPVQSRFLIATADLQSIQPSDIVITDWARLLETSR